MTQSIRTVDNGGTIWWKLPDGTLHRDDGPAIERLDGYRAWYLNGLIHREDGPAIEYSDGAKEWYLNGDSHREDGPAVERPDGTRYWYLNGKMLFLKTLTNELKKTHPVLYDQILIYQVMTQ